MDGEQNNVSNVNVGQGESRGGSVGPIIGIILILAVIILGGLYFWSQRANEDAMMTNEAIETINTQNTSDETTVIEADLNATDVENLDAELNAS